MICSVFLFDLDVDSLNINESLVHAEIARSQDGTSAIWAGQGWS